MIKFNLIGFIIGLFIGTILVLLHKMWVKKEKEMKLKDRVTRLEEFFLKKKSIPSDCVSHRFYAGIGYYQEVDMNDLLDLILGHLGVEITPSSTPASMFKLKTSARPKKNE